jgi:hypothetical protein
MADDRQAGPVLGLQDITAIENRYVEGQSRAWKKPG